jgi:hypothetical protein
MSTRAPLPPALPNIGVAVIDPKTGIMNVDWYKYFLSWDRINRLTRAGAAGDFTANGTVATAMSSLGPTGAHTTIQKWLTITDDAGNIGYVPVF